VIDVLGPQGDGIHKSTDGPVYVERALPGEKIVASIQRGSGGALRGEITQITTPSPDRIAAPCAHYTVCGGCTLQHATDDLYRAWKLDIVRTALSKVDLEPKVWLEPTYLEPGTRRRVTFAAFKSAKAVTLGYFRRRSHNVTEIANCLVADSGIMELRTTLAPLLVPILQGGKPAEVFIQSVNGLHDVVITGAVGAKGVPDAKVYAAATAIIQNAKVSRISWRAGETNEPEVLLEASPIHANFGALRVPLPPLAFLQPTALGEKALSDAVMSALPEKGKFADLFSGCGTFSGPMLERGTVDAFENNESAIQALNKARAAKPLNPVKRDLFRNPLQPDEFKKYDAVVFDPPRAGAAEQVKILAQSKVRRVIGVSCNPNTFARDARVLVDGGYTFDSIKVVDQFTWSHHVELVAVFTKSKP
jgi:23S rRNA (uracil1939-C5)-methyltransferase